MSPRRAALADVLGLSLILIALADYLRPALLLLDTYPAGGDTPCHYPTLVFLHDYLLPRGRLHGWYAGSYLGQPLLLYYFPLPFLLMSALAGAFAMPVAFKLVTALGVFLLPLFAYAGLRLLGFRFPGPLLGAAGAYVFLLVEDNPIWGGTLGSTLAGELSYTYGIGLALAFLGLAYRSYARGHAPTLPALALALTGLAHGYAVLWAGLSACFFLYESRRPLRTLLWLGGVALLSAGLIGFWLLPLLVDWRWTTPFNDAWISVGAQNLLPPALAPLLLLALLGLAATLTLGRRRGGADRRLLYLWHAAAVACALAAAGPALGIVDVRFLPFAQLAVALAGAASLALALEGWRAADAAALGLVLLALAWGDARAAVVRYWAEYDFSGLQAKELWPAWSQLSERLRGSVGDARVAVEYSPEHERAGSIRMYETLPFFSGRCTLEGPYNQASLNTHAVYYVASELGERSPNPFRNVEFSSFDTDAALAHLRLFATDTIVALSDRLVSTLRARADVEQVARVLPYTVFRLREPVAHVEPLRCVPVVSGERGWREKAQRWFTRRPLPCAPLVFGADPALGTPEPDEWLAPPERSLPGGVEVRARLSDELIEIETSRIGHPLLVKVSWHPRWRASGADGPYRVAPALMLVVPREHRVTLRYGPNRVDTAGHVLTALALLALFGVARQARRGPAVTATARLPLRIRLFLFAEAPPPRRWGGAIPLALLLALTASRALPAAGSAARAVQARMLVERAQQAAGAGRFADAAEYARHALARLPASEERDALDCLRGESLLSAGRPDAAREAFASLLREGVKGRAAARARRGLEAADAALRERTP